MLAAGQGKRIRSVIGALPNSLITFNNCDWTILDQQICALSRDWLQGRRFVLVNGDIEFDPQILPTDFLPPFRSR